MNEDPERELMELRKANCRLGRDRERLRTMLKRIQWADDGDCPVCHAIGQSNASEGDVIAHAPGCELAALLAQSEITAPAKTDVSS